LEIRAFKALRPEVELAEKIASPPYDVLDREEAFNLAKDNPYSFLHVSRSEIDLAPDIDAYSDMVYKKAAENFAHFQKEGRLVREKTQMLYLYRLEYASHIQTGLVACCSVKDYENDVIKKHERTREDKEQDRTRHIEATRSHSGPVFIAYRDIGEIKELCSNLKEEKPIYDFTAPDGVRHTVFRIPDSIPVVEAFKNVPCAYIADGHHRAASAVNVAKKMRVNSTGGSSPETEFFLAVLFPASELKILPYNRCVKDLNGLTKMDFLTKVSKIFKVTEGSCPAPSKKGECSMYLDGVWYGLSFKEKIGCSLDPCENLDVSILQNFLLEPLLGIKDPRKDKRIEFVGGIRGVKYLEELVDHGKAAVAFSMYPTRVEEMMAIADAGKIMPPKSTWFEPKLRDALFIHTF
jgi:uncharacterized protein (DUF1015 family)